ncbi:MAG: dockerin type I repeat-containing protein [Clostridia bacterium]|nr:dockerin type I repeat-containing protein [Clostridia bacterium]
MKKQIGASLLAAALLLLMLPLSLTASADDLPLVNNIKISKDGILSWDAYPGAHSYYVYGAGRADEGLLTYNVKEYLTNSGADTGDYTFSVSAENESYQDIALSKEVTYRFTAAGKMATPTNLRWGSGYIAKWDAVPNADRYMVTLYEEDIVRETLYPESPEAGFSKYVNNSEYTYYFVVVALHEGYANSAQSDASPAIKGRFYHQSMTIYLSGDLLIWGPYKDTEGATADQYYLYQPDNPTLIETRYQGTSINLKQMLDEAGAEAGVYTFYVDAERIEDGEIMTVSGPSNQVVYVYGDALLKGDVDGNGIVNMADAFLLYRGASGQVTLTEVQQAAGDMDDSKTINMADAFQLYRLVSGAA